MGLVKLSAGEMFDQSQPQDGISATVCRCGWDRSNFLWPWSNFLRLWSVLVAFFIFSFFWWNGGIGRDCSTFLWKGLFKLFVEMVGIGQTSCECSQI